MTKKELRKIYKEKRKSLSTEQITDFENIIYSKIKELDFQKVSFAHIFLPIKRLHEINTYPIIHYLWSLDVRTVICKSDFSNNSLSHFIYDENTLLEENKWNIPEPINGSQIAPQQIDLVFVPMLISDELNYRVGYGKGFYDRFLAECRPDIQIIGLNYFKPIKNIQDKNKYDIPLDTVIYGEL